MNSCGRAEFSQAAGTALRAGAGGLAGKCPEVHGTKRQMQCVLWFLFLLVRRKMSLFPAGTRALMMAEKTKDLSEGFLKEWD